jgi:large subunit ribosomal protein L17
MASSLIIHKRIKTTVAKAKALRLYIEPLITKSKVDSTHSRRVVFSYLNDKEAVTELFRDVVVKVADRPGGYTRIIKIGARLGDNAEMALIELVDYNENLLEAKAKGPKKTRRRRSGKKEDEAIVAEQAVEVAEEVVEDVAEEVIDETAPEVTEEVKAEPKEEPKAEAEVEPEAEVKEEPREEPVAETKEEIKEDPEEVPAVEVKEEVKEEAVAEEKPVEEKPASETTPEDDEKKDKKE